MKRPEYPCRLIFSATPLRMGHQRIIRGFVRLGMRQLVIARELNGEEEGRIYVAPDRLSMFVFALIVAHGDELGTWSAGQIDCASGVQIEVEARVSRKGGSIVIDRRGPSGRRVGGPITIAGEELKAFARGVAWMQEQERAEVGAREERNE